MFCKYEERSITAATRNMLALCAALAMAAVALFSCDSKGVVKGAKSFRYDTVASYVVVTGFKPKALSHGIVEKIVKPVKSICRLPPGYYSLCSQQ